MGKKNYNILEKNRKDYKIRGYRDLSCDIFFQSDSSTYNVSSTKNSFNEISGRLFFPKYEYKEDESFYTTVEGVKVMILGQLFKDESLENIHNTDIKIKVLKRKINKFGIDTILVEISPTLGSYLDFLPLCIIIYAKKVEYESNTMWRKVEYFPGDNLGIYIPVKYNTVTIQKQGILIDNKLDILIEVIEEIHPGIYRKIEDYLPEDSNSSEFDEFALETIYNMFTGETIPEIKYNKEELIKSMELIQV